eukprot:4043955-Pleurochrysis_carterae.AAC.3
MGFHSTMIILAAMVTKARHNHLDIFDYAREYEPLALGYSNGLCYIPPRMTSMVYGHGIGITNIRFAHLIRPTLERMEPIRNGYIGVLVFAYHRLY